MFSPDFDKSKLNDIKMLILDVDGVLTNGAIMINDDGVESKMFNVLDGHGVKLWQRAGNKVAIISGRAVNVTSVRAAQLGIEYVFQGCKEKKPVYEQLLENAMLTAKQVAFIGDDVVDIPIARNVGFAVAVKNAVEELKQQSDYTTEKNGGAGAVREVVELILKQQGKWDALMERYMV